MSALGALVAVASMVGSGPSMVLPKAPPLDVDRKPDRDSPEGQSRLAAAQAKRDRKAAAYRRRCGGAK